MFIGRSNALQSNLGRLAWHGCGMLPHASCDTREAAEQACKALRHCGVVSGEERLR